MDLQGRIKTAKNNKYELNNIINEYKPFIANVVQKKVGKFVHYGSDDELSIGLLAFEEAIKAYNEAKGPFLSFAENVISKRLIDYYRKESKYSNTIPLSTYYEDDQETQFDVTQEQSISQSKIQEESQLRKLEILDIQKELGTWGISFFDLPDISPKHDNTKKQYRFIIEKIINDNEILNTLKLKKYFPVAKVEEVTGINRKLIERSRNYVIALVIILTGDYEYIKSYISWR